MKKDTKIAAAIVGTSFALMIGLSATAPQSPYTSQLNTLHTQLSKVNAEGNTLTKETTTKKVELTTPNVLSATKLGKINTKAKDLMTNLYTWSSSKEYTANKLKIVRNNDVSATTVIDKVMPDDKDTSGNSQIDALNVTSKLVSTRVYSSAIDTNDVTIIATVTATTDSDVTDDNTPLSNEQIYTAHYDDKLNAFTTLTYVGKGSLSNSTGGAG